MPYFAAKDFTKLYYEDHVQVPAAIFAIENAPHSMQAYCPEETAQAVRKMMEM